MATDNIPEKLMKVKDVAAWMGINEATVYTWAKSRRLPHIVISIGPQGKECLRFRRSVLEEWLRGREREAINRGGLTKWDLR